LKRNLLKPKNQLLLNPKSKSRNQNRLMKLNQPRQNRNQKILSKSLLKKRLQNNPNLKNQSLLKRRSKPSQKMKRKKNQLRQKKSRRIPRLNLPTRMRPTRNPQLMRQRLSSIRGWK